MNPNYQVLFNMKFICLINKEIKVKKKLEKIHVI